MEAKQQTIYVHVVPKRGSGRWEVGSEVHAKGTEVHKYRLSNFCIILRVVYNTRGIRRLFPKLRRYGTLLEFKCTD
jgi:hypothetical protein